MTMDEGWMADFLEASQLHIKMKLSHYMLSGKAPSADLEAVSRFVEWCVADDKEMLTAPRGRDKTNYLQRREACRKSQA